MDRRAVERITATGLPLLMVGQMKRGGVLHPEHVEKFEDVLEEVLTEVQFVYATGTDSPYKDYFCASLMWEVMRRKNLTGRWLTPPQLQNYQDLEGVGIQGITVVVALDLMSKLASKFLSQAIRENATKGCKTILCCSEEGVIAEQMGQPFREYLDFKALKVDLNVTSPNVQTF